MLTLQESADAVRAAFSSQVAPASPKTAATWALNIQDEALRDHALEAALQAWKASDVAAARAWLSSLSMPPEKARKLINLLE